MEIWSFALVVTLLVISPGPNLALVIHTSTERGVSDGLLNAVGIAVSFWAHGTFVIFGLTAFLHAAPHMMFVLKVIGALYLMWLGVKAFHALKLGSRPNPQKSRRSGNAFLVGFLTNLLNPKVAAFYVAVLPIYLATPSFEGLQAFMLVLVHSIISLLWFSMVTGILGKYLSGASAEWFVKLARVASGLAMLFFGFRLLTWRPGSYSS